MVIRALVSSLVLILLPLSAAAFEIDRVGEPISHPWGITVLNDEEVLVTARAGALFRLNWQTGVRSAVRPTPAVAGFRQGGMLDVAAETMEGVTTVYLCYSQPGEGGAGVAVMKAELDGDRLENEEELFVSNHRSRSGVHFGCRLVIDGPHLYLSIGDRGDRDNSQRVDNHAGAILRVRTDGTQERANNQPDWLPELYSVGHRNPQGMAMQPNTGQLWAHEHGPRGGDEINRVEQDRNYGWPIVSQGKEYIGGSIGLDESPEGYEEPLWVWNPSIAPSGMLFYTGSLFPEWQGDLLVGALKYQSIYRVSFDSSSNTPASEERMFEGELGRIRDIEQAPDGSLLVLVDDSRGGVYRITP